MSIHRNTGAAQSGLKNIVENIADSKVLAWKIHFLFFSNKIERITFLTRVQALLLGPFKTVLCSIRVLDCHSPLFFRKIVRRDTGGYVALWPPVKAKWSISKNLRENRRLWTGIRVLSLQSQAMCNWIYYIRLKVVCSNQLALKLHFYLPFDTGGSNVTVRVGGTVGPAGSSGDTKNEP